MTSDGPITGAPLRERGAPPAVAVRDVRKEYGKVVALDGVELTIRKGTVHALVGENGSGKSTLTKIIAGVEQPTSGTVSIDGESLPTIDPRVSIAHGVRVIYQDLALFPNMTVAENLSFSGGDPQLRLIRRREVREHAEKALAGLGLDIDPNTRLGDLSTAERQLVAIARTVSSDGRIVLMDEPTAALTQDEIDSLLETIRSLSAQGLTFLFISHKLREVVSIADDVTVIRDGQIVATGPSEDYDQARITELMTGGVVENLRRAKPPASTDEPVVQVRDLTLKASFRNIDLDLYAGRVVGLAGLVGSGRIEIGLAVAGLVTPEKGEIRYRGEVATNLRDNPRLQYVPDDRLTEGLFLDWSIADNIAANDLDEVLGTAGTVSTDKIVELGTTWRDSLRIKAPDVRNPASSLSGGNQQRVLLARALAPRPDVIVLNNPTVGVDIGSRAEIHDVVRDIAGEGTAVLVISDEPAELLSVCDEIVFVHDGQVTARHGAEELDEEALVDIISRGGES
ncbi:sugar ABC transporter ATP-binding protein [Georgenia sp. H159]|uniref:sugar ABC transporter ATP-binding protein n=1 Tax=Georgenia sp. H159 TaxID=3076115 RepID=UPI002D79FBCE|nr:sugar ABC transporter ATP-binding protein [Georgenia sp. H159]